VRRWFRSPVAVTARQDTSGQCGEQRGEKLLDHEVDIVEFGENLGVYGWLVGAARVVFVDVGEEGGEEFADEACGGGVGAHHFAVGQWAVRGGVGVLEWAVAPCVQNQPHGGQVDQVRDCLRWWRLVEKEANQFVERRCAGGRVVVVAVFHGPMPYC
jgi:hypothetical protein